MNKETNISNSGSIKLIVLSLLIAGLIGMIIYTFTARTVLANNDNFQLRFLDKDGEEITDASRKLNDLIKDVDPDERDDVSVKVKKKGLGSHDVDTKTQWRWFRYIRADNSIGCDADYAQFSDLDFSKEEETKAILEGYEGIREGTEDSIYNMNRDIYKSGEEETDGGEWSFKPFEDEDETFFKKFGGGNSDQSGSSLSICVIAVEGDDFDIDDDDNDADNKINAWHATFDNSSLIEGVDLEEDGNGGGEEGDGSDGDGSKEGTGGDGSKEGGPGKITDNGPVEDTLLTIAIIGIGASIALISIWNNKRKELRRN